MPSPISARTKTGALGKQEIPFSSTDRIIAIGSDRMMAAVTQGRHGALQKYLKPTHRAIGSINSPMQCMMKEICAHLSQRLARNGVQEKLTALWIGRCLKQLAPPAERKAA